MYVDEMWTPKKEPALDFVIYGFSRHYLFHQEENFT